MILEALSNSRVIWSFKGGYIWLRKLVERGIKSNYDLLDIEKEYNVTKGDLQTARLSVARSNFAITEAKNRIKEKIDTFKAEASRDLQKTTSQINKFEAKMGAEGII